MSDRMSKEKQKFFRLSAFNADKKKDKKKPTLILQSRATRHNVKKAAENKRTKEQSEGSSSSTSECSSSSDDDDDDSDSTESDSDSSTNHSETLRTNNHHPLKIPTLFTMNNNKTYTFGSISGLNVNNDGMWGFAAAAAEVQKKQEPVSFAALAKSNKINVDTTKSDDDKVSGQVKGLFDGLSHLFAAPNETRSRNSSTPNYNPTRRKRPDNCDNNSEDAKKLKTQIPSIPSTTIPPPITPTATTTTTTETVDYTQMTPSNLVKTAVNCKRHELERRKFLKADAGLGGFAHSAMLEDARMKKRNLIAEATQTNHHPVLSIANNQTGKIGAPYLLYIRTLPQFPTFTTLSHRFYTYLQSEVVLIFFGHVW